MVYMNDKRQSLRRHPAEITNERLLTAYERWFSRLSGQERDAISMVRNALWRISEEDEGGK